MNCYLVEGAVIIKYYVSGNSICEKVSNLVMADNEDYRVDWCSVKQTIV